MPELSTTVFAPEPKQPGQMVRTSVIKSGDRDWETGQNRTGGPRAVAGGEGESGGTARDINRIPGQKQVGVPEVGINGADPL